MSSKRPVKGTIYLLCFSARFKHAGHYLGWASDLEARLTEHRNRTGARLVAVIIEAGLTFFCARTWEGTRADERRLKNRKETPRLCPRCNKLALRRAADLKKAPAKRATRPATSRPRPVERDEDEIAF